MNYTVQKRIKEIIELLNQIINDLDRNVRKFDLDKPNAEKKRKVYQSVYKFFDSQMKWENIVLEKSIQLKKSIQNEYHVELEELEKKEAVIKDWAKNRMNPEVNKVRDYFFDEHFLKALFYSDPRILLELGKLIITDERINWKPTFLKLANELIQSSNCDVESFENFVEFMNSLQYSTSLEGDTVWFLFSPKHVDKKDLEQKMESNYERFLIIDKLMIESTCINQIIEPENDMELVLSSLINSDEGYQHIPESLKSNELVYLFAAFNSSHSFMYANDNIRNNEAVVNFALNKENLKGYNSLTSDEMIAIKKQHARTIYTYASEEIKANEYIANKAFNE